MRSPHGMGGFVFYRAASQLDGALVIGIAIVNSGNRKRGSTDQTWIIGDDLQPVVTSRTGAVVVRRWPLEGRSALSRTVRREPEARDSLPRFRVSRQKTTYAECGLAAEHRRTRVCDIVVPAHGRRKQSPWLRRRRSRDSQGLCVQGWSVMKRLAGVVLPAFSSSTPLPRWAAGPRLAHGRCRSCRRTSLYRLSEASGPSTRLHSAR